MPLQPGRAAHRARGGRVAWRRAAAPLWCALLGSAVLQACSDHASDVAQLAGATMGTSYSIKLWPAPDPAARTRLLGLVEGRLEEINRQMSTYRPDSDLTRFNRNHSSDWQTVPRPLVDLVAQAARISQLTDGRYDVTVGPLVDLWGFGSAGSRSTPPPADQIAAALQRTGYRHLALRQQPPAMRKAIGTLQVDLSSIAKGWAVDRLAALLEQEGFGNFLVEIGGELRARGTKPRGSPWQIAIEQPVPGQRGVQRIIALRDMAVATSGDYRNFFEDDGTRYSHTIDPVTGQPVRHRLGSVTVFADNCTAADAWATALMALGESRGPELAADLGLMAMFVVRDAQGLREQATTALARSGLLD